MADATPEPTDPYDLDSLRLDGHADFAVERVLIAVPARKPKRNEFFRVHPGEDFTVDTYVVEHEDDMSRDIYLVAPSMRVELVEDIKPVRLFTCVSRRGSLFLWPAKLPSPDNRAGQSWAESALVVAEHAKHSWVKMVGSPADGAYVMYKAHGDLGSPDWGAKTFKELIALAFKGDKLIDSADHPVVRDINGES